jgi:hypothetical protein
MRRSELDAILPSEEMQHITVLAIERKEKKGTNVMHGFPKVFLLDEPLEWLIKQDWKEREELEFTWHTLAIPYYFPNGI